MEKQTKANRKTREGVVISDKMSKTVVVEIERKVKHPLYKKIIRITNTFKAHDEKEIASSGDKVRIIETRPMSSGKRWVVLEVIGRKKEYIEEEDKGMPAPVRRVKEPQSDTK